MTEAKATRSLPSLRRYLLYWFAGCAIVMAVVYAQLLEYYLELGIDLRTQTFLEQTAEEYEQAANRANLPSAPSLAGYLDLTEMPAQMLSAFSLDDLRHGEAQRFVNLNFDAEDEKEFSIETGDFCPEGTCELMFLYPYQLADGEWLYLLHGIVGSDEIYEELQFTEQVAFAIGSLFAGLLVFVMFLVVRNVNGPLRRLNSWSEAQSAENLEPPPADLRFDELETLASRIQFAFERMREGVDKEKLFLRHASHELRTPIAILASNAELIERLTERPERSEAEQAALLRQARALEDIQLLIETLLWINRQSDNLPKAEQIDLRHEVEAIVASYRYLIEPRPVTLVVDGAGEVSAPLAAVRIVLSNLVRNAFQYTVDGEVTISVSPGEVAVANANSTGKEEEKSDDDEYGFGLGLELVALICQRFDWRCRTSETPRGRTSVVEF